MKENKLAELSLDFSVDIINLVKHLKASHESVISNQIGRSGTSSFWEILRFYKKPMQGRGSLL